jgi:hypothetical protein
LKTFGSIIKKCSSSIESTTWRIIIEVNEDICTKECEMEACKIVFDNIKLMSGEAVKDMSMDNVSHLINSLKVFCEFKNGILIIEDDKETI